MTGSQPTALASLHAGAVGLYLALTGKRLSKPADLLRTGLATHFVRAERLPQLTQALGLRTLKRSSTKASALSGLEPMLQQFNVRFSLSTGILFPPQAQVLMLQQSAVGLFLRAMPY